MKLDIDLDVVAARKWQARLDDTMVRIDLDWVFEEAGEC